MSAAPWQQGHTILICKVSGQECQSRGREARSAPPPLPSWLRLKLIPEKHYYNFFLKDGTADTLSGLSQPGGGGGGPFIRLG